MHITLNFCLRPARKETKVTKELTVLTNIWHCTCEINTNTHFLFSFSGFEFIQQPKAFDAYMCKGRCPARYNALNDHSLLQSIMHLKTKKHTNSRNRVHKPCCVGTKFQPLDILHVDDKNPSKLKVTHWKNVIVSDCGCA